MKTGGVHNGVKENSYEITQSWYALWDIMPPYLRAYVLWQLFV